MKRFNAVLLYAGTPPASVFNSTDGTPIVVDSTTGKAYVLIGTTVTLLSGGGGGGITALTGDGTASGTGSVPFALTLGVGHQWTATQNVASTTLTDAATITPVYSATNNFYLLTTSAVGASRTINIPSGTLPAGAIVNIEVEQPASGGPCAVVWASGYKWGQGGQSTAPLCSTVASAVDTFSFQVQHNGNLHGAQIGQSGPAGPTGPTGPAGSANFAGTSTTSNTVGTGSLTFTTQSGLAYAVGARIRIASSATPANFVEGICTAYSGTSLTINSDTVGGSGTIASWNLSIAGQPGTVGLPHAFGVYLGTNQALTASTWTKIKFDTKEFDTNTEFDATTNYRYAPLTAGYYQLQANAYIGTGASSGTINIYKNGVAFKNGIFQPGSGGYNLLSVVSTVYANGSDYFEIWANINGSALTLTNSSGFTYFNGHLVK